MKTEPELYCDGCGRKLEDGSEIEEEATSPRITGRITCDACFHNEHCDECVICGEYMRKEATKYVLLVDEIRGVRPGCYKFERPWFADGVIEITILQDALTKIRDIRDGEADSGYVCNSCAVMEI